MLKDDERDDVWPLRACNAPLVRKYRRGDFGAAAEGLWQALAGDRMPTKPDPAKAEPDKQRRDWQLQQVQKGVPNCISA
jgi:hypothetical protein